MKSKLNIKFNAMNRRSPELLTNSLNQVINKCIVEYYQINARELNNENIIDLLQNDVLFSFLESAKNTEDELLNKRYEALINLEKEIREKIDPKNETLLDITTRMSDCFHNPVKSYDEYIKTFVNEPIEIKKMRVMQLLNRLAHKLQTMYYKKFFLVVKDSNVVEDKNNAAIGRDLYEMDIEEKNQAKHKLQQAGYDSGYIKKMEADTSLKYLSEISKWLFRKKKEYIIEVIKELDKSEHQYSYGFRKGNTNTGDYIIFDVPEYGQFALHLGPHTSDLSQTLQKYGLGRYELKDLNEKVFILQKADPKKIKDANIEQLEENDRIRYNIITRRLRKKIKTKPEGDMTKDEFYKLIEYSGNEEKYEKICKKLENAGIEPEKCFTPGIIRNVNPDNILAVIDALEKSPIGLEILPRCKSLCYYQKSDEIDLICEQLDELKIGHDIVKRKPNILIYANPFTMEKNFNVLKKYNMSITDDNIEACFSSDAQNIRKNLDYLIENGYYNEAYYGDRRLLYLRNKNIIVNMNILKFINQDKSRKIRIIPEIFSEKIDLLKKYNMKDKNVIDSFEKLQKGQEFIQDDQYYSRMDEETLENIEDNKVEISKKAKILIGKAYKFLEEYEAKNKFMLQIDEYTYSIPKVKRNIKAAILNTPPEEVLDDEQIKQICKIALLKDKNIEKDEYQKIIQLDLKEKKIDLNMTKEMSKLKEKDEVQLYEENIRLLEQIKQKKEKIETLNKSLVEIREKLEKWKSKLSGSKKYTQMQESCEKGRANKRIITNRKGKSKDIDQMQYVLGQKNEQHIAKVSKKVEVLQSEEREILEQIEKLEKDIEEFERE